MTYLTAPLDASHDREAFSCGKADLDAYLKNHAGQDMKRHIAVVFVLPGEKGRIKGYYTLSNDSIPQGEVPEAVRKKMPKYKNLPVTLLGRLAVDQEFQGQKLGLKLLLDALFRSCEAARTALGSIAVVVDPLDAGAAAFYERYGFILLPDRKRLFLPMKTIEGLF
ncbi:MAG: GNAT family N-acetyltransferase [Pseudomonadota bacterium]